MLAIAIVLAVGVVAGLLTFTVLRRPRAWRPPATCIARGLAPNGRRTVRCDRVFGHEGEHFHAASELRWPAYTVKEEMRAIRERVGQVAFGRGLA